MNIFISQTKGKSREVAEALQDWLRTDIRLGDPWTSEDIPGGKNSKGAIKKALKNARFGILCITADNQTNQWIIFEAGVLESRGVTVFPYIIDLEQRSGLPRPINDVQGVFANEIGTKSLVSEINKAFGYPVHEATLMKAFDNEWPAFEKKLDKIRQPKKTVSDYEKAIDDFIKIIVGINEYRKKLDYSHLVNLARESFKDQTFDREAIVNSLYKIIEIERESLISQYMSDRSESPVINIRNFFKESFTKDDLRKIVVRLESILSGDVTEDLDTHIKIEELEVYLRYHQRLAERMREELLQNKPNSA